MTSSAAPPDPFNVVAQALGCARASLSIDSAMYRDHGWDSFGHVTVIAALEEAYRIRIGNDEMMRLTTMRSIIEISERSRGADPRAR